jgi:hypothetical protein
VHHGWHLMTDEAAQGWVWWPVNIRKVLTLNAKPRSAHN